MITYLKNAHKISKIRAEVISILSGYQPSNDVNPITDEETYQKRLKLFGKMCRKGEDENILSAEANILNDYNRDKLSNTELSFIKQNIDDGRHLALVFFAVGTGVGRWHLMQDLGEDYLRSTIRNSKQLIWMLRSIPTGFVSDLFEKLGVNHLRQLIQDSCELAKILDELGFGDREQLITSLGLGHLINIIHSERELNSILLYLQTDKYNPVRHELITYYKAKTFSGINKLIIKRELVYLDNFPMKIKQQLIRMFDALPFVEYIESVEQALKVDGVNVISFVDKNFRQLPHDHESNEIGKVLLKEQSKYFPLLIDKTPPSYLPLWSCDIVPARIKNVNLSSENVSEEWFEYSCYQLFIVLINLITCGKLDKELKKKGVQVLNYKEYMETLISGSLGVNQVDPKLVYISLNPQQLFHRQYATLIKSELIKRGYQVVTTMDSCDSNHPHFYSANNILSASHICFVGGKTSKALREETSGMLSFEYAMIFNRLLHIDNNILAYAMHNNYKENFPFTIYSLITLNEIACFDVGNAKIKNIPVELKEAINETQKLIIDDHLRPLFDKLNEVSYLQAIKTLDLMKHQVLSPTDKKFLSESKTLSIVEQVQSILSHPRPQNRFQGNGLAYWQRALKWGFEYKGIQMQNQSIKSGVSNGVVYYHENDNGKRVLIEMQGLLGLTSKNDNTAPTVTKIAVVNYIHELINKAKVNFENKAARQIQFWYRRTRDENNTLEAIKEPENSILAKNIYKRRGL